MSKKLKKKEVKALPLVLSIPLFLISWVWFISSAITSIGLVLAVSLFSLFLFPISLMITFLFGFLSIFFSNHIVKRFRQLKKKK